LKVKLVEFIEHADDNRVKKEAKEKVDWFGEMACFFYEKLGCNKAYNC